MKFIPLTQGMIAGVDDEDFDYLNQWKWRYNKGYAVRSKKEKMILMHREILKTPHGYQTDHINGNALDNRKENLRICTWAENQHNAKLRKDNTSGYKGVFFCQQVQAWRATIGINKKRKYIGKFDNPIDAAIAYDVAAKQLFGKFAKTNF